MSLPVMSLTEFLIRDGYLPTELPPAFSTLKYSLMLGAFPNGNSLNKLGPKSSRCAFHSLPRLHHARRLLGIPNPFHQLKLAALVERYWCELDKHMKLSPISLTRLEVNSEPPRALSKTANFEELETVRVLNSSAARYVLKA